MNGFGRRSRRLALALVLAAACAQAQPPQRSAGPVRFAAVDVFIDSPAPLAAWQFEFSALAAGMTVVGVENGASPAFADAPYYDLDAVEQGQADRIVVADFSLGADADLPRGPTRVATIHVRLSGPEEPAYQLRLIAAGDSAGRALDAAISFELQPGRQ